MAYSRTAVNNVQLDKRGR